MTDKSRTERRLIESIRQVKTDDEAPLESDGAPETAASKPNTPQHQPSPLPAAPKSGLLKASIKDKAESAQQRTRYQSPGRVWPD